MIDVLPRFIDGVVVAAAGGFFVGLVWIINLLIGVKRAVDHLGPSLETLYLVNPYVLKTLKHQNDALQELGADGSTVKANECIDAAEKLLDDRLAALERRYGMGQGG